MANNRKDDKSNCMNCLLTSSLILTMVLLSVLLALTIKWRTDRINAINGLDVREQTTCDVCDKLGSYIDTRHCSVGQDGRCCCETSYMINALVGKSADTHFGNYHLKSTASVLQSNCTAEDKPAGKMIGLDTQKLSEATHSDKDIVYFKRHTIQSIQHSNGRFSISQPGLYYVFSQIKYEHTPEKTKNNPVSRQRHSLFKHSSSTGQDTKLLEKTRSFSELHGTEKNKGTSFIGAVFEMEKDDQIMVQSSHTDKLAGDNDNENFFGLYII